MFKVRIVLRDFRREANVKGLVARLTILKGRQRREIWLHPSIMGFWVLRGDLQAFKEK
jgi:hypothetical protein